MRRNKVLVLLIILITFLAFNKQSVRPKKLSEFKQTDFLPTLEHKFSKERNSIYCSSFLNCWEELLNITKSSFKVDSTLKDLYLVNNSKSHLNTLKKEEYSSKSEIHGHSITLRSQFNKSLPFENRLLNGHGDFKFGTKKVASFGMYGDESSIIQIMYYKNDNNFILKLIPKDKDHEIILSMSEDDSKSMAEMISDIETKTRIGQAEKQNQSTIWKYKLTGYDIVDIPKIGFNIETNYAAIEGNRFKSNTQSYAIGTAWQRIAFYLDEKGAEINTDSEGDVVFLEPMVSEDVVPKHMIFNKPFFLMLKRTNGINPYFGIWVANTELMN